MDGADGADVGCSTSILEGASGAMTSADAIAVCRRCGYGIEVLGVAGVRSERFQDFES